MGDTELEALRDLLMSIEAKLNLARGVLVSLEHEEGLSTEAQILINNALVSINENYLEE